MGFCCLLQKKLLEQLLYQDYSKEDLPEISGQKGQMSNSR